MAAALGDVNALLKNYPDSEKYYRQALAATPGKPELHRALGQTLLEEQKLGEAENEFRTALKLDPHNREAMMVLPAACISRSATLRRFPSSRLCFGLRGLRP